MTYITILHGTAFGPQEQIDKYNDTKKKDLPCYKFQSGQCRFGDECHFSHTIESRDSMQQRGADSRPGDWGCDSVAP